MAAQPWLVVIDPQRIFADPASEWASPMWPDAVRAIQSLLPQFPGRTIVTRWVPPRRRPGSWAAYMAAWPFADRPPRDPYFDLVPELADVESVVLDAPTFGKWPALQAVAGDTPELVLCGVATDCCVISTALPAADAGATITVVSDACAGSTPQHHAAALQVMGLYPPQITLATAAEVLGGE
ncbi:MAG: cysteine hydrolase [Propionibacteriaceae bacterium]|nr:cysteine hydrolase [Propionibacteriaceae bacterium]